MQTARFESISDRKTNDAGNFTFPLLDPGAYTVETDRVGFKRANRTNVKLDANSTVRVDFRSEDERRWELHVSSARSRRLHRGDGPCRIQTRQPDQCEVGCKQHGSSRFPIGRRTTLGTSRFLCSIPAPTPWRRTVSDSNAPTGPM